MLTCVCMKARASLSAACSDEAMMPCVSSHLAAASPKVCSSSVLSSRLFSVFILLFVLSANMLLSVTAPDPQPGCRYCAPSCRSRSHPRPFQKCKRLAPRRCTLLKIQKIQLKDDVLSGVQHEIPQVEDTRLARGTLRAQLLLECR